MFKAILLMIIGIVLGFLNKNKKKKIEKEINYIIQWNIYLLIFIMGIQIGNKPEIMNNLTTIGIKGILYGIIGTMGSILLISLIQRFLLKHEK